MPSRCFWPRPKAWATARRYLQLKSAFSAPNAFRRLLLYRFNAFPPLWCRRKCTASESPSMTRHLRRANCSRARVPYAAHGRPLWSPRAFGFRPPCPPGTRRGQGARVRQELQRYFARAPHRAAGLTPHNRWQRPAAAVHRRETSSHQFEGAKGGRRGSLVGGSPIFSPPLRLITYSRIYHLFCVACRQQATPPPHICFFLT